jgi:hypothetical protein
MEAGARLESHKPVPSEQRHRNSRKIKTEKSGNQKRLKTKKELSLQYRNLSRGGVMITGKFLGKWRNMFDVRKRSRTLVVQNRPKNVKIAGKKTTPEVNSMIYKIKFAIM